MPVRIHSNRQSFKLAKHYRPWEVITPVACPIISNTKINTDRPMRQVNDLTILSDVSPLTILTSAEPRLNSTKSNSEITIILYMSGMLVLFSITWK